jgi:beta-lactamase regulating signal transducer with metallopeptidase domain
MQMMLIQAAEECGVLRPVRLRIAGHECSPMTFGVRRPVIIVPASAAGLSPEQLRALLLHEAAHIRSHDWVAGLVARCACAVYWFHPAVWFIARSLRDAAEVACDDAALRAGVRPSDHAQLLLDVASRFQPAAHEPGATCALVRASGLRRRIEMLARAGRDIGAPRPAIATASLCAAVAVALSAGTVRLAPSRETLQQLMLDARWESRAWAVMKLAQRADSIDTARAAALDDPNPHVRASARAALAAAGRQTARSGS